MLCCQYSWRSPENLSESRYVSDTRGRANLIWIRIGVDVEILEVWTGPKNSFFLLFKWMMSAVQTLMPQTEIDS